MLRLCLLSCYLSGHNKGAPRKRNNKVRMYVQLGISLKLYVCFFLSYGENCTPTPVTLEFKIKEVFNLFSVLSTACG